MRERNEAEDSESARAGIAAAEALLEAQLAAALARRTPAEKAAAAVAALAAPVEVKPAVVKPEAAPEVNSVDKILDVRCAGSVSDGKADRKAGRTVPEVGSRLSSLGDQEIALLPTPSTPISMHLAETRIASHRSPPLTTDANRYTFPINPAVGGKPVKEKRNPVIAAAIQGDRQPSPL